MKIGVKHMGVDFVQLLKLAKKNSSKGGFRLAVLGDSATQYLSVAISGYGIFDGFPVEVYDADYDQIELQAFDDESELYKFEPDAILIYMCRQKLYEKYCECNYKENFADAVMNNISALQEKLYHNSKASIIQFTFENDNDMAFGNYGMKLRGSYAYQTAKLNLNLMEWSADHNYCYLIDINRVKCLVSAENFCDPKLYCNAKMSVSPAALPEIAKNVIDIIKAIKGCSKKCIILDLDNTLWGGVIGDDGIDNIEIGELGIGYAFTEFQTWLKELKKRGIILCICSKNNESVAKEPFEKHPDMVLKLDDIAIFVANWDDKASNILNIQKTLNIGMDSIVFIDDNPFERNLVRELISDITVPELPEDPARYYDYLRSLNLFETISYSENDSERTHQYQAEIARTQLQNRFSDFDEYLKSLEMVGEAKAFEPYYYPRISQLTQRSNQFNLRTVRYTEADIERIASDNKFITLYYTLKDKFGDHGLVSVVILEKRGTVAFVDTWLMSCRVLKRGMEEYVVNSFMKAASNEGMTKIEGEYIPTEKNMMVKDIYTKFGFKSLCNNKYEINISDYENKKNHIK